MSLVCKLISHDEYRDLSACRYLPNLFTTDGEAAGGLSANVVVARYSGCGDIYVSHDWGRELGVDNHARVVEAGTTLRKMGLRANIDNFGLLNDDQVQQLIDSAQCGIVFITRRYVRRYEGKHYLSEEYDYLIRKLGYQRVIFVVMEKRMANKSKWTAKLNIPDVVASDLLTLDMFIDRGVDMLVENVTKLHDLALGIIRLPLDVLAHKIFMHSYDNIFSAVKSGRTEVTPLLCDFLRTDHNSTDVVCFRDGDSCTLLHHAAASGNADNTHAILSQLQLIGKGDIVNLGDKLGRTPLFIAASLGHVGAVEHLLVAGADPNKYTIEGHSPLYEAALNGHLAVLQLLIDAKADINLADTDGLLPVDVTTSAEIKDLLTSIADTHKQLLSVAQAGNVEGLQALLQNYPKLNVNFEDEDGRTALFLAVVGGHTEMVRQLLAANADIAVKDNWLDTPLAVACFYEGGDSAIVELLLAAGSSDKLLVWSKNAWGNTAFHNALQRSQGNGEKRHIIALLLQHGANINEAGVFEGVSCTPLQLSLKKSGHSDLLQLLEAGAEVDNVTAGEMLRRYQTFLQPVAPDGASFITLQALSVNDFALWFRLLQLEPENDAQDRALQAYVLSVVKVYPHLANAKDEHGRVAVDVATKANKTAINSYFLWHGRYRIIDHHPEHVSATCYVYRALDENTLDASGQPIKVALKLIRHKSHFIREIQSRRQNFDPAYVVSILTCYPAIDLTGDANPFAVLDHMSEDCFSDDSTHSTRTSTALPMTETTALRRLRNGETIPQLSKYEAEMMYCIVMPLADRNMFVCLKQERFAGKVENIDEIGYVFLQLVRCVGHMHSKGLIHGDIKTLNMVRSGANWQLIDLDAACEIGVDKVGFKASSAYIPPEALFVDKKLQLATVRSEANLAKLQQTHGVTFDLLIAHPSFDVWSLGCILYQLCTPDVRPLFQGGQDDNLTDNATDVDNNLFAVAEWSESLKTRKLSSVIHPLARNLLSQMLHKDWRKRPTIDRVLAHPFLSKKQYTRLVGQDAAYDVFISYRVASDLEHAEVLYNLLTEAGAKVWWDKRCLKAGVNWEQGFCSGLVNSRYFVSILSRGAINQADNKRQNFGLLQQESPCDNVLLEMRLALELHQLGLIEKVFPIFIGDKESTVEGDMYGRFFEGGCLPAKLPEVSVQAVEAAVAQHLEDEGLGSPLLTSPTVKATLDAVLKCNGAKIEGHGEFAFAAAVSYLLSDQPAVSVSAKLTRGNTSRKPSVDVNDPTLLDPMEANPIPPENALARADSKVLQIRRVTASATLVESPRPPDLEADAAVLQSELMRLNALLKRNLELQEELRVGRANGDVPAST